MGVVIGLIWGAVAVFGLTAVGALVWALHSGQLERFAEGARSIFDEEEPVGMATDATLRPADRGWSARGDGGAGAP